MLAELTINPITAVLVAAVLAGVILAIRRIVHKGLCDCDEKCGGCKGCDAAKKMAERLERL